MKKPSFLFAAAALLAPVSLSLAAEDAATSYPAPSEIVAAAPASDWTAIDPNDLLVMELAPDAKGKTRRVVIQLMPAPFSQGWVGNIRKLAAAKFWDGLAIVRVQDNYVSQWGDPDGEDTAKAKKLPDGLVSVPESEYEIIPKNALGGEIAATRGATVEIAEAGEYTEVCAGSERSPNCTRYKTELNGGGETYAGYTTHYQGWPIASNLVTAWPTHCYGMVGVGRNLSPDTGTGAELYTVIGHAPRHLDRNIALVGRVIEGMEYMSSLPRGTGDLGFYKTAEERTPILSVRIASEMESDKPQPRYEFLNTESASFAKYAEARANRRDPFFIKPAGGADICNIPVPVRRKQR
jgi:cyclophilin family peptidyl-prolyl cis-trans isomerase